MFPTLLADKAEVYLVVVSVNIICSADTMHFCTELQFSRLSALLLRLNLEINSDFDHDLTIKCHI